MELYFELILQDKIYIQRTPNSKFIELTLEGEKIRSYETLPDDIKKIFKLAQDMERNPHLYFDYEETYDGIQINNIKKIDTPYVKIPEKINEIKVTALTENCAINIKDTIENIQLPETINRLENQCFSGLKKLKHINFPESLKLIGAYSFEGCESLVDSNLENIEVIGLGAFEGCSSIKEVILNKIDALLHYAFKDCTKLEKVEINMPQNCIGTSTFENCTSLKEVILPNDVERILKCAFKNCALTKFIAPSKLELIYEEAFYGNKLETISINKKIKNIDSTAFLNNPIVKSNVKININEENIIDISK